jgi:phenylalanyl-tRNA synthetase beta subunit
MKISHNWLQTYFDTPLPSAESLAELVTFHAFEVEGIEPHSTSSGQASDDSVIDISILPNRAHDCLSYEGMAREISVLTGLPIRPRELKDVAESDVRGLEISVEDSALCPRYMGRVVEGIKIGPSPEWLKTRLASIGQRSINNVVDIMNFVMFETGQPLHAFDADKLGASEIIVRKARAGEKIATLDGKDIALDESVLVIADKTEPLAIAGIKGGKKAEVDDVTNNIIIESANFAPGNIRKTSRKIGIRTDASARYENEITPEKTATAMKYVVSLLSEHAAGANFKAGKTKDVYPRVRQPFSVGVSVKEVNALLGTSFAEKDIADIFAKLHFEFRMSDPHKEVIEIAKELLGVPYRLGASISYDAPKEFDCSSLASYLYARSGVRTPRQCVDIFVFSEKIKKENLIPGDIIFSNTGNGTICYESVEFKKGTKVPEGVDHCGIYIGDGKVLHATRSAGKVVAEEIEKSEPFKNIVGYGRVATPGERRFVVTAPTERLDLRIKEDLVEEIGRVYGYEKISPVQPALGDFTPAVNKSFYYADAIRRFLTEEDYSEVSTYAFTDSGDIEMENPIASDKKYLRRELSGNIIKALELNGKNAPLLGLETIKLFEIGKVFEKEREYLSLCIGASVPANIKKKDEMIKTILFETAQKLAEKFEVALEEKMTGNTLTLDFDSLLQKLPEHAYYEFAPKTESDKKYKKISPYPFVLRDIAVFVPEGAGESDVLGIIKKESGSLLVRTKLFDVFQKTLEDGSKKTSYAFRMVFQSQEKTLSDDEVNEIMEKVTSSLNANEGWHVR